MTNPQDGGAEVLSYNVQWDAGSGGMNFIELVGYTTPFLSLEYTVLNSVEGLTPGLSYKFKYRAGNKYGWGEYSTEVSFVAAAIPLQALPVTTQIENYYVKIQWEMPNDQSSEIIEYEILIKQQDGKFSKPTGQFCKGTDWSVVQNRYCHVPMQSVLRQAPFNLQYNDLVVARIRARNQIGFAVDFSNENSVGARVQVLPSKMASIYEGLATDDTRIQINWSALEGDETGGAAILSYNLEMLVSGVWIELVGQTSYYTQTFYLIQTNIVSG